MIPLTTTVSLWEIYQFYRTLEMLTDSEKCKVIGCGRWDCVTHQVWVYLEKSNIDFLSQNFFLTSMYIWIMGLITQRNFFTHTDFWKVTKMRRLGQPWKKFMFFFVQNCFLTSTGGVPKNALSELPSKAALSQSLAWWPGFDPLFWKQQIDKQYWKWFFWDTLYIYLGSHKWITGQKPN